MRLIKLLNYFKFNASFVFSLVPFYFNYFKISNLNKHYVIYSNLKYFNLLLFFFKNFSLLRLNILGDLCVVDFYTKKNRFKIIYNILSLNFGYRFFFNFF